MLKEFLNQSPFPIGKRTKLGIQFNRQTSHATAETASTLHDAPTQMTKTRETQCSPHVSPNKSQSAILDKDYPTDANGTRA